MAIGGIFSFGKRPYPLDRERRRKVLVALAEQDLTIASLARALNISRSYVSEIISGRDFSDSIQQKISEYLGKPADYLFPFRTPDEIKKMRQAEQKVSQKGKAA